MADPLTGGCRCGAVRYSAAGAASSCCHCHCESCRRSSGAAFVTWATFPAAAVEIRGDGLCEHASSDGVLRGHCARCGTAISYRHAKRPREIDLTVASLDRPEALRPTHHIWAEEMLPWTLPGDGLPQHPRWAAQSST